MKTVSIVPAAGKGTRVKLTIPKILINIGKKKIIDIIIDKLKKVSNEIIFIVNPIHKKKINDYLKRNYPLLKYGLILQRKPRGMFDAVYRSLKVITKYNKILIMWGDHIGVKKTTIHKVCKTKYKHNLLSLPLVLRSKPYVEYVFINNNLKKINEAREGDNCSKKGLSDVGFFLFYSNNFKKYLDEFNKKNIIGKNTKEKNFLPFITYISNKKWEIKKIIFKDKIQSIGVNTRKDIKLFKNQISKYNEKV